MAEKEQETVMGEVDTERGQCEKQMEAWREFLEEHGISRSVAHTLWDLGIRSQQDLVNALQDSVAAAQLKPVTRRKLMKCRDKLVADALLCCAQSSPSIADAEACQTVDGGREEPRESGMETGAQGETPGSGFVDELTVENSRHFYLECDEECYKLETLRELIEVFEIRTLIVYVLSPESLLYLKEKLTGTASINCLVDPPFQTEDDGEQEISAFQASICRSMAGSSTAQFGSILISTFAQAHRIHRILHRGPDPAVFPRFGVLYDTAPDIDHYMRAAGSPYSHFSLRQWTRVILTCTTRLCRERYLRYMSSNCMRYEELPASAYDWFA